MNLRVLLLLVVVFAVGVIFAAGTSQTPPRQHFERAHFSVPAEGVDVFDTEYDYDWSLYRVFYLYTTRGKPESIGVRADSGYYVSKAGRRYPEVMVLPGEEANIRRVSDHRPVALIVNYIPEASGPIPEVM